MTEERIEGGANQLGGRLQEGVGAVTGDRKSQVQGQFKQAKGALLDAFGRAVDALDGQVDRVPEQVRPQARKALGVAREKPVATMLGLAAVTFLLTRRRR
ncbi:MAG: CsbD family protein [Proteobacteria bacterium]|nr:CsbD family protein [Pseudomonadota bacterium]